MLVPLALPLLRSTLVALDWRCNVPEGLLEFQTHAESSYRPELRVWLTVPAGTRSIVTVPAL